MCIRDRDNIQAQVLLSNGEYTTKKKREDNMNSQIHLDVYKRQVYDEAADYVADFDADDRDMKKYIIGTIGSMDMPMEAVDMGARSFHAYFLGKTEADLQKVRDQVLSCTQEDIRALAPIVKAVVEAGNRCCIGNEEKIDQNKEYFDEVKRVL